MQLRLLKSWPFVPLVIGRLASAQPAPAPGAEAPPPPTPPPSEPSPPEKMFDTRIYGYINPYWEVPQFVATPVGFDRTTNQIVKDRDPPAFDVLNLNVMVQGTIGDRYRYFLNLAAPGAGDPVADKTVAVRNAWLEVALYGNYLQLRAGKLYRRFGLYNEILDAVPTFIGIEPPEILDPDHLMITRTTNFMLHGAYVQRDNRVVYSVATGNDERASDQVPIGIDVQYDHKELIKLGVSYYDTLGDAVPGVAVGDGSPKGGVVNWMASDRYRVADLYAQYTDGTWIAQVEYAIAKHHATRDSTSILALAEPDSGLSPAQYARFFSTPIDGPPPTSADVRTNADYTVQTAYFRLGYEFEVGRGTLTPYVQGDWYRNPEVVGKKKYGGDNEAGWSDDGQFFKTTLGFVYRPISAVALKVDSSTHTETFAGQRYTYPELRVSFSYFWELAL